MRTYLCPFCKKETAVIPQYERIRRFNFVYDNLNPTTREPHIMLILTRCRYCGKDSVRLAGMNGYMDDIRSSVYPRIDSQNLPEYIPLAIRTDYEEACAIADLSPKAAATLTRRCLQGMVRDCWCVHERNLYDELSAIKNLIPEQQWLAIDAVRQLGNIGAHMQRDINLIIDIDPGEAHILIRLIEVLIREWYIQRLDKDALYREVLGINTEKSKRKEQNCT